ncbi:AAA family ATPase [Streptomyces sp. NPDC047981]|uniref:helix-turn-helix transcriptional regulator n=1 Tax=Streptomyces sp. NPDC047981 TaxID=3154610 RepID=UPI003417DF43
MSDPGVFVGRDQEYAKLRDCALAARGGHPWLALVEGDAGMGKTELLRRWLDDPSTADFAVLRARCDAAEQDFAYGVVQQLIAPLPPDVLTDFPLLTEPIAATAPPFQMGRQLLELLAVVQDERPVAVVIDDVHWADTASVKAWGFVLKRLEADSLLTVLTTRTAHRGNPHLQETLQRLMDNAQNGVRMRLQGLDTRNVADLISQVTGERAGAAVAEQLRRHTAGNPLYLNTVVADLSHEDLSGRAGMNLPVPTSLAMAIHAQLSTLSETSRALVEAAAVLATPAPLHLVGRLADVKDPVPALEDVLATGLLRWQPAEPSRPVELAHALQQQAVIEAIAPDKLRTLHARAATLVDERASWAHRVAAADPFDDRLIPDLAAAAEQAFRVGEAQRSATLLLWAADLDAAPTQRERHLLDAAVKLVAVNSTVGVATLLPRVKACAPCALRSLILGASAMYQGELLAADTHFAAALAESEQEDDRLAGFMSRVYRSVTSNLLGNYEAGTRSARQALTIDPTYTWAAASLSQGMALSEGPAAGLRELSPLAPRVAQTAAAHGPVNAFVFTLQGAFRTAAGDLSSAIEDCATALALNRSQSAASALPDVAYTTTAVAQYLLGDWDRARTSAEHALDITGNGDGMAFTFPSEHAVASWVAAGRGEWATADRHIGDAEQWTRLIGGEQATTWTAMSRAVRAQARGDHQALLAAVEPLARVDAGWPNFYRVIWLPLHAEALIGVKDEGQAKAAVARLEELAQAVPCLRTAASWLSGLFSEAAGDIRRARDTYERALAEEPPPDVVALHQAMLEHSYARVLAANARPWFDRARQRLETLRARPFLQRCAQDYPAAERHVRAPGTSPVDLTGRERDIASLVGRGLTNKEIASELFISSKTVEYHLGHVYGKLGIANRRELRNRVQQSGADS